MDSFKSNTYYQYDITPTQYVDHGPVVMHKKNKKVKKVRSARVLFMLSVLVLLAGFIGSRLVEYMNYDYVYISNKNEYLKIYSLYSSDSTLPYLAKVSMIEKMDGTTLTGPFEVYDFPFKWSRKYSNHKINGWAVEVI